MLLGQRIPIPIIPGVNPYSDSTALDTPFFTMADKVRFQSGKLRKIKGWQRIFPVNNQNVQGFCRTIFSTRDNSDNPVTLLGTSYGLYAYLPDTGDYFYNITPLQTTGFSLVNALSTEYNASVTVSVTTVSGSPTVTLGITNYFQDNDIISISGVTGGPYHGIPASAFNIAAPVSVLSTSEVQISLGANATSSGAVNVTMTWAAGYIYINYPNSGITDGERIGITGADAIDGIPADDINQQFIVSNIVDENNFVVQTGVIATSLVGGVGGAGITIFQQIPGGAVDESYGFGYGGGQYGYSVYGAGQQATGEENIQYPRIWSIDNFNNLVVMTTGDTPDNVDNVSNIWYWEFDISVAPVLVSADSNVPKAITWLYVSNNTLVTLGAGKVLNTYYASDVNNINGPASWTPGAATYSYSTMLAQATGLISQARARNFDLLFTQGEVYIIEFVDKPDIWFFRKLFATDGIIAPRARAIIEDSVFWMGNGDFYGFDGYTVAVLPNNTVKRYVYDNINQGQASKCFTFANVEWSEVWFFYPAGQDIEPNNYVIYNYKEFHWTTGTLSRTAAEERVNVNVDPLLAQSGANITTSLPNSLNSYFYSLSSNPITTTDGSNIVQVAVTLTCNINVGDLVKITGATATGGLTTGELNGVQQVTAVINTAEYGYGQYGAGEYGGNTVPTTLGIEFAASANATSSATGGGASVTLGTQVIGVIYTGTPDLSIGEEITISGASTLDGFSAAEVNITAPITYINGDLFQINVNNSGVFSTSSVTAGGGAFVMVTLADDVRVFSHETGFNDYNNNFNLYTDLWSDQFAPMNSYAQTNYSQVPDAAGNNTSLIYSVYPDITMQQNMTLTVNVKEFAQSPYIHTQTFTMTPTTTKIDPMMIGRVRQYTFTSNVLEGNFLMGRMFEELQPSTPR